MTCKICGSEEIYKFEDVTICGNCENEEKTRKDL